MPVFHLFCNITAAWREELLKELYKKKHDERERILMKGMVPGKWGKEQEDDVPKISLIL